MEQSKAMEYESRKASPDVLKPLNILYIRKTQLLSPTIQLIFSIYLSLIRVIESRIIRWAEHAARTGKSEKKMHTWFRCVNLDARHNLEDLERDGRKILKCIFYK